MWYVFLVQGENDWVVLTLDASYQDIFASTTTTCDSPSHTHPNPSITRNPIG